MCMCACVRGYLCMYVCILESVCLYTVNMYVCAVSACVSICACIRTCVHICAYLFVSARMPFCNCEAVHVCVCARLYTASLSVYVCLCAHTRVFACCDCVLSLEVHRFVCPSLSGSVWACGKVLRVSALSVSAMCVSENNSERVHRWVWEVSVSAGVCVCVCVYTDVYSPAELSCPPFHRAAVPEPGVQLPCGQLHSVRR